MGASAAVVVCLGAVLGSCGSGGDGGGYAAVGAGAGPSAAPGGAVRPTGGVTLVPLDGTGVRDGSPTTGDGARGDRTAGPGATAGGPGSAPDGSSAGGSSADGGVAGGAGSSGASGPGASPSVPAGPGASSHPSSAPSAPATSAAPAALSVGEPVRTAADERWCEKVSLALRNTGGSAVRSGTVTFGTHIIGALGVDWATIGSTVGLPVPIEAGARQERTWTVCVDAWRVPLGMHVETRDVSVRWE
ncbi:hypothetical protein FNH09_33275 [Streptomyces adustus]|uniref:Uncharacterized protein n=1 Tax=Streptomyces adustus TaxID=1609272 RepID=A0A5N8VME9_9ACTN|nr:hypothetical protein [Streptomyces adustus]